jgi:NADPH-dependent glutamate synthase beta subunit-like oxidoreductase
LAAGLAKEAGFDGIDIQCNRAALPETLARIQDAAPGLSLTTRVCTYEATRGGFGVCESDYRKYDLSAPLEYVRRLVDHGLTMLNVTSASPCLLGVDRGKRGILDSEHPEEHPLMTIARQLALVRALRTNFPTVAMIGSGLSWLRQFVPHVASGAVASGWMDVAGLGRAAMAYPNLPALTLQGDTLDPASTCMVCHACAQLENGAREVGCVLRDADLYGPIFRDMRRFEGNQLLTGANRCHLCEAAPCREKSPTQTDIPAFIKAYRQGRDVDAYQVIRSGTPLPEMVAQTSPSWLGEEGACVEATLTGTPVPIQDIQYAIAWNARQRGWTGICVPADSLKKRVAIIGGGPAGIAAATRLVELGYHVSIHELSQHLGGVPARLLAKTRSITDPGEEISALLAPALETGRLEVLYGKALGRNIFLSALLREYDAVLVAVGLWRERSLGEAKGVIGAVDLVEQGVSVIPRRVAVLAGGDSAMDACSALHAWGCGDIHVVFEGPRSKLHWHMSEGWFAKPGVHAMMNWRPLGYVLDSSGKVEGLRLQHSELGVEVTQPADLIVNAMGLEIAEDVLRELSTHASPFLYTAGAIVNGGASVSHCIAEGLLKAESIHQDLSK